MGYSADVVDFTKLFVYGVYNALGGDILATDTSHRTKSSLRTSARGYATHAGSSDKC